jgi:hypothetical protein
MCLLSSLGGGIQVILGCGVFKDLLNSKHVFLTVSWILFNPVREIAQVGGRHKNIEGIQEKRDNSVVTCMREGAGEGVSGRVGNHS